MDELTALIAMWEGASTPVRVILVLLALHPIASAITAATPDPDDDKWYAKFYKYVVRPLALNVGLAKKAPENKADA